MSSASCEAVSFSNPASRSLPSRQASGDMKEFASRRIVWSLMPYKRRRDPHSYPGWALRSSYMGIEAHIPRGVERPRWLV
jgi:hypothetical protein